jgi:photosystem II stability/assembly factor-like uncharacterized protein
MARFTVRVELHDATWDDYAKLHGQMTLRGFANFILDTNAGTKWQLPPAEYNYEGALTRDQVLTAAEAACTTVGKRYSVLVTESAGRTWSNLQQVR